MSFSFTTKWTLCDHVSANQVIHSMSDNTHSIDRQENLLFCLNERKERTERIMIYYSNWTLDHIYSPLQYFFELNWMSHVYLSLRKRWQQQQNKKFNCIYFSLIFLLKNYSLDKQQQNRGAHRSRSNLKINPLSLFSFLSFVRQAVQVFFYFNN